MATASYQYVSDTGVVYQAVLPVDFAGVFGYVPATGSEPPLPAYMSPRYLTYVDPLVSLWVNVYVTVPTLFSQAPKNFVLSGNTYSLKSSIAETRGSLPGGNFITIAGPQGQQGLTGATGATGATGPAGSPGVASHQTLILAADVTLVTTGYTTVFQSSGSISGTYLELGVITVQSGSSAGQVDIQMTSTSGGTTTFNTSAYMATANQWLSIPISNVDTVNSVGNLLVQAKASVSGFTVKKLNADSQGNATQCTLLKLA